MDMEKYGVFTRLLSVPIFLCLLSFPAVSTAGIFNDVRATVSIRDLAFNGTRYVASGNNAIWTSTDLRHWQEIELTASADANLASNDVAWGNGMFVATADAGLVSSPDGITWTLTFSASASGGAAYVTFVNGIFMATGTGPTGEPTIVTSTDGLNWTTLSVSASVAGATQYTSYRVGWGNGLYVLPVFTDNFVDVLLTSPDGVNWSQANLPNGGSTGIFDFVGTVAYGNGLYVAGGDSFIYTSPDGVNWTLTPFNGTSSPTDRWISDEFSFINGEFVAVGRIDKFTAAVFTSPDGINWTPTELGLRQASFYDASSIVYNGTDLVIGGDLGVWKGPTATRLTKVFTGPQTDGGGCIGFGSGEFLVTPWAAYNDSLLMASTNGVTWPKTFTNVGFDLGGSMQPGCVASNGGLFVIAGGAFVSGNNQIYSSADGLSWNLGKVPGDSSDIGQVTWDAVHGSFVSLGSSNGYTTGAAFTSSDGLNWSETSDAGLPAADMSGYSLRAFAGIAFAFSGTSLLESSDGGNSWTAVNIPAGFTEFDDVAYGRTPTGSAVFVAAGGDSQDDLVTATSSDGVNWTTNPSLPYALLQSPASLIYGGGDFVAAGSAPHGSYFVSHDGVNWTAEDTYSFGMDSAAWDGTRFVAISFVDTFEAPGVDLNLVGAAPAQVNTGKAFNFTVTVKDATTKVPATDVLLLDTLPAGVSFVGVTATAGSCTQASGLVTCNIPSVVSGTPVKVTISVKAGAVSGTATNSARAVADQPVYDSAASVISTSVVIN